ncbi:Hypothetical_protein [Hexamita inflata]|uniref:Hypothetical_protein n=1 Tax=Hexamita inflata TaxID=28002 RepID=A0AA86UNA5_9EUKA|nr:Hypothetical protein HINF_LOCUS33063 [Hexamita inflata]
MLTGVQPAILVLELNMQYSLVCNINVLRQSCIIPFSRDIGMWCKQRQSNFRYPNQIGVTFVLKPNLDFCNRKTQRSKRITLSHHVKLAACGNKKPARLYSRNDVVETFVEICPQIMSIFVQYVAQL